MNAATLEREMAALLDGDIEQWGDRSEAQANALADLVLIIEDAAVFDLVPAEDGVTLAIRWGDGDKPASTHFAAVNALRTLHAVEEESKALSRAVAALERYVSLPITRETHPAQATALLTTPGSPGPVFPEERQ